MALWHFTDNRGQLGIVQDGYRLRTLRERMGEVKYEAMAEITPTALHYLYNIIWVTDLDQPWPSALGLADSSTDKTEHVFRVRDESGIQPWATFARSAPRASREYVEARAGAMPGTWLVATAPVPVAYVHAEHGQLWTP